MNSKLLNIFSIISTIAIISWMISDFFGGLIIYLLMYWWIIFPLIIIYVVTGIITIVKTARKGIRNNKIILYTHILGILSIIIFNLYQSEIFKSKILLDATLVDDLRRTELKNKLFLHYFTFNIGFLLLCSVLINNNIKLMHFKSNK